MGLRSVLAAALVMAGLCVGEWWRGRARPDPPAPAVAALPCVVETPRGLEGRSCSDSELAGASAGDALRWSLGLRLCWWTADGPALASIGGVGERLGERLVAHRDAGGAPDARALESVRGVGPSLARRIEAEVATRCGGE